MYDSNYLKHDEAPLVDCLWVTKGNRLRGLWASAYNTQCFFIKMTKKIVCILELSFHSY